MRMVAWSLLIGSLALIPHGRAFSASVQLVRLGTELISTPPVLTPTGAVLFEGDAVDPDASPVDINFAERRLIHVSNSGDRTLLTEASALLFHGGGTGDRFRGLDHWNGTTVLEVSDGTDSGVFAVDEFGAPRRIAGPGDPLPSGTGTFADAISPYIGPAGIAFEAQSSDGVWGLYMERDGGPLELVTDEVQVSTTIRDHVVSDDGIFFLGGADLYHAVPGESPELFLQAGSLDLATGFELDFVDRLYAVDAGHVYFHASERPIVAGVDGARVYRMAIDGGDPEQIELPRAGSGGTLSVNGDNILYGRVAAIIDGEFVPIVQDDDILLDREVVTAVSGRHALADGRAVLRVNLDLGVREAWMAVIVPEPTTVALLVGLFAIPIRRSLRQNPCRCLSR